MYSNCLVVLSFLLLSFVGDEARDCGEGKKVVWSRTSGEVAGMG